MFLMPQRVTLLIEERERESERILYSYVSSGTSFSVDFVHLFGCSSLCSMLVWASVCVAHMWMWVMLAAIHMSRSQPYVIRWKRSARDLFDESISSNTWWLVDKALRKGGWGWCQEGVKGEDLSVCCVSCAKHDGTTWCGICAQNIHTLLPYSNIPKHTQIVWIYQRILLAVNPSWIWCTGSLMLFPASSSFDRPTTHPAAQRVYILYISFARDWFDRIFGFCPVLQTA